MKSETKDPEKMAVAKTRGTCGVLVILLAAAVWLSACSRNPEPDPRVGQILDRLAVQDAVNELFRAVDLKDWRRARIVFTEKVNLEMPDLIGGGPAEIPAKEVLDAWARRLEPVQGIHHQTGNFGIRVLEFGAYVTCYVAASRYDPGQQRTVAYSVGSFDFHLVRQEQGWKIDAMRYKQKVRE